MNAFQEAFDALRKLMLDAQGVYDKVHVGALPPNDSMCAVISTGAETNTDIGHHGDLDIDVVLNAKHKSQAAVIDALTDVHYMLSRMTDLPKGNGWQLLDVSTSSFPTFVEHDGDQFLYGSGFRVLLYLE